MKSGEKSSKSDQKLGIEIEHFLVDRKTLETKHYFSEKGVQYLLDYLVDKKEWMVFHREGENVLGIEKDFGTITVEPGGQVELSLKPEELISSLEKHYDSFLLDAEGFLSENDLKLVCFGYHPVSKIEDIPFNPKKRYQFMSEYLASKGSMAHNMMKGSAAVQVAIDYHSEEDFKKKFKIASFLSPILSFLFDNSPVFQGKTWEKSSLRAHIWENCDIDRCGMVPAFNHQDFGYEKYADYIINTPLIFIPDGDDFAFVKSKTVKMLENFKPNDRNVEHALSMVFPDVRAKKYIEIRMIDSVPKDYSFAFLALVQGLFYSEANIFLLDSLFAHANIQDFNDYRVALMNNGTKEQFMGKNVFEWGEYLLKLVELSGSKNVDRLEPLRKLWSQEETLKSISKLEVM